MAYIKVNHSKFTSTAEEVDEYVRLLKSRMDSVSREVESLRGGWQGMDQIQFDAQWNQVRDPDSTYQKMIKSLESYANFLRFAGKKYRDAQASAVNRANGLRR